MTLEKVFEIEKNGYCMHMVEDKYSSYKSISINTNNDDLPTLYPPSSIREFSEVLNGKKEFKINIGTVSVGSLCVDDMKEFVNNYETAIKTAMFFENFVKMFLEE